MLLMFTPRAAWRHLALSCQNGDLNQYWFSPPTIQAMVDEVEAGGGKAAFLSTPSVYFSVSKATRASCKVFDVRRVCCAFEIATLPSAHSPLPPVRSAMGGGPRICIVRTPYCATAAPLCMYAHRGGGMRSAMTSTSQRTSHQSCITPSTCWSLIRHSSLERSVVTLLSCNACYS